MKQFLKKVYDHFPDFLQYFIIIVVVTLLLIFRPGF